MPRYLAQRMTLSGRFTHRALSLRYPMSFLLLLGTTRECGVLMFVVVCVCVSI